MNNDEKLLTLQEAAAFLRTPIATMRFWRSRGLGPASFKIGRRVYYCQSDILSWLDTQRGHQEADDHRGRTPSRQPRMTSSSRLKPTSCR